jgi:tetratricopeptide (TPR) repeat protein
VLVSVLAGAAAGAAAGFLSAPSAPSSQAAPAVAPALAPEAHDALERRTSALEREVEALRLALADARAAASRTALAAAEPTAAAPEAAPPSGAGPQPGSAQDSFEALLAGGVDFDRAQEMWKEIERAGRLDELIAAIEARAQARPNDPAAQTELGQAYLQKVFRATGPEAGLWATNADRAFDAALAIDERHWEARFSKAMSLSFWPPVFGKQAESVRHFETLAEQQEGQSPQPHFAQTYLLLGNLHQQMGQQARALAAWKKGLSLFPNDPALLERVQQGG